MILAQGSGFPARRGHREQQVHIVKRASPLPSSPAVYTVCGAVPGGFGSWAGSDFEGWVLTRLKIRNFKRFDQVEIELASPVVFLGPNNSGKTTAMQALALWEIGLKRWREKWSGSKVTSNRAGVTLNRRDLAAMPVPKANLLWTNLHVRDVRRQDGRQVTSNVRIEIVVEGTSAGSAWQCGLEFDYANEESFYCRPLRIEDGQSSTRMDVPDQAGTVRTAFLAPLAGLSSTEMLLPPGAVSVRIGEGRTAEVLRNLCLSVHDSEPEKWQSLAERVHGLFGVEVDPPVHRSERGEITMTYRDGAVELDISAAGRGLHQTLLLLAYMYARPCSVLLLDEPDAHLEPLRQRQVYRTIREVAGETGCQAIIATHSEVLLNEAADQDLALAFVGEPHRIGRQHRERVSQSLRELGYQHYMQAAQTGWVLYLSGPTDLSALQGFARRLGHEAAIQALQRPFVHYVADSADAVSHHFQSLVGVVPTVRGLALLNDSDGSAAGRLEMPGMACLAWKRGRIEHYVCTAAALESYAVREGRSQAAGPLFASDQADKRLAAMRKAIEETEPERLRANDPTSNSESGEGVLEVVFRAYRSNLGISDRITAPNAGDLVGDLPDRDIDPEICEKLDGVVNTAAGARTDPSS